jgi:hypothetical protein
VSLLGRKDYVNEEFKERRKKLLSLLRIEPRFIDYLVHNPFTIMTELSRLPVPKQCVFKMVSLMSRAHNTGGEISWRYFARATKFLLRWRLKFVRFQYFASCHHSGAWNFKVVSRFQEDLCIPVLMSDS